MDDVFPSAVLTEQTSLARHGSFISMEHFIHIVFSCKALKSLLYIKQVKKCN